MFFATYVPQVFGTMGSRQRSNSSKLPSSVDGMVPSSGNGNELQDLGELEMDLHSQLPNQTNACRMISGTQESRDG